MMKASISSVLLLTTGALAMPASVNSGVRSRDITSTSDVWLGSTAGDTAFMASGVLLGLPLNGSQIPDPFLSNIGFWNMRSGGSQLPAPSRGWTHGYEEFLVRSFKMLHFNMGSDNSGPLKITQV